jgi:site-specific recombinase XerD
MLEEGVPTEVVADMIGHSSMAMIDRYYSHIQSTATYDIKAVRERRAR